MRKEELDGTRVFLLREFLSNEECANLTARSEQLHYDVGTLGGTLNENYRNNDRAMIEDHDLAQKLFQRARLALPDRIDECTLTCFDERWRFYRYLPGHAFRAHCDGRCERLEFHQRSYLTFMIYLNDQMIGGETRFFKGTPQVAWGEAYLSVRPEPGMALVFKHDVWHEGAMVESGQKLVLRTDVMYQLPKHSV